MRRVPRSRARHLALPRQPTGLGAVAVHAVLVAVARRAAHHVAARLAGVEVRTRPARCPAGDVERLVRIDRAELAAGAVADAAALVARDAKRLVAMAGAAA